jgi:hypothetical protein
MGKKPVMTGEFEDEGMGVTFVYRTAGLEPNMAENDSTAHHPCQPLEAVVNPTGNISSFCRFLHYSAIILEVAYAPAIHVLASLLYKEWQ